MLSLHKSTIDNHCLSKKHMEKKSNMKNSKGHQQQLIHEMDQWQQETNATGITSLTDVEKDFRHDVLFSFLSSPDKLESINHHRPLLEEIVLGRQDRGRQWRRTRLELVTVVEAARPFVQITYILEGDGALIFYAFDALDFLLKFIEAGSYPVIDEFIETMLVKFEDEATKNRKREQYKTYCMEILPKAHAYFRAKLLDGDVGENLELFKLCRLGNPSFMKQLRNLHPGEDGVTFIQHEVEKMIDIPFIDELTVKKLIQELPAYFKYAEEFAGDWLFTPPTAPTTIAEVHLSKKQKK